MGSCRQFEHDLTFYVVVYVQHICRAGRDGLPSQPTMYCNATDVASNVKHLSPEIRGYYESTTC